MSNDNDRIIYRTKRAHNFVTLPNEVARDSRLSFKARGIMLLVFSNVDEWQVTQGWLEQQCTEGREAIRSGMQELERLGYAVYKVHRDKGMYTKSEWTFYDEPVDELLRSSSLSRKGQLPSDGKPFPGEDASEKASSPCDGKPIDGLPHDGKPSPSEDYQTEYYLQKTISLFPEDEEQRLKTDAAMKPTEFETQNRKEIAERIYAIYPKKCNKLAALKAIELQLKSYASEFLFKKAEAYALCRLGKDPTYTRNPDKWFRDGGFLDDVALWTSTPAEQARKQQAEGSRGNSGKRILTASERFAARKTA